MARVALGTCTWWLKEEGQMKIAAGLRSMTACVPYQVTPTSTYYPATIQPVIPKCTEYTDISGWVQECILPSTPNWEYHHTANSRSASTLGGIYYYIVTPKGKGILMFLAPIVQSHIMLISCSGLIKAPWNGGIFQSRTWNSTGQSMMDTWIWSIILVMSGS